MQRSNMPGLLDQALMSVPLHTAALSHAGSPAGRQLLLLALALK
jgi:hypothetical protein